MSATTVPTLMVTDLEMLVTQPIHVPKIIVLTPRIQVRQIQMATVLEIKSPAQPIESFLGTSE